MARVGSWLRKSLALLAICAGSVATIAATPTAQQWSADPEEQFLLDVNIRQFRLGDGVRAYNSPEGTCIMLGDFLTALDVPMKIDLAAKKASGWAFREENRISIDLATLMAEFGTRREPIASGTVRETPEGWCVQASALTRWFGIGVKPVTSGSALILESDAKLPVELAMEREQRAANLKRQAKFDVGTLPQVRLPYRMWRAPALDFVVSAGVAYRAKDGVRVDRRTSLYAAGEIARLSYDAQLATSDKGKPNLLRMRAYRSDPDGALLGPLKATHFGFGDVAGLDSRLTGTAASGRGAIVTNRPLGSLTAFDRKRFEGDLPAGWDAELYRNGELIAFTRATADQRYVFDDVQLLYGENRIGIILYGPHGQVRTREELINVGQDNVPPGKTWYWAGVSQPGRDLIDVEPADELGRLPKLQATVAVEHGLGTRTSVGALARMMLIDDERLTFVEGSVRQSVGPALIEVAAARSTSGGMAARAQAVARFGSVNLNAEALIAKDFHLRGVREENVRDLRVAVNAPLKIGRAVIPAQADVRLTRRGDGQTQIEAAARLAANIDRFNLATDIRYRKQYLRSGPAPPGELEMALIGAGRIGDVRLRGQTSLRVAPETRLREVALTAYWSASDTVDWEGGLAYDASGKRALGRLTHIRRLDTMALALTGEAASDGSVAVGFNLNFSLDPARGFHMSRQPLAGSGVVHARVYRDLNDNGLREETEPLEKDVLVTTGTRLSERSTNDRGLVTVGGLATFIPITVGVDHSSLADPLLAPKKALQVVVPRPGVPAEVEIGLVGAGDIEGALVKSGGIGFEGLDLELVDDAGKVIATARSDFDGFFLFERVPYGHYRIRISAESATIANVAADLNLEAAVSSEKSVARLGAVHVTPLPVLASTEAAATQP